MQEPISGDALRGHLETMILSVLEQGDAHGFEVLRRLEGAGSGLLKLKEGSVYPALYRLEEAGYVSARWEGPEVKRRGPRRRIYRLTRKGQKRLQGGRVEWRQCVEVVGTVVGATA